MKKITSAKELSSRIAEKLGLAFEAKNYDELAKFVEEVTPAIDEEFIWGKTSFEDFWRGFEDDSPIPFWQIIADKKTIGLIMNGFDRRDALGDTTYYADDYKTESESLDDMPEEGEVVADVEPYGSVFEVLEALRAFSEAHSLSFSFKLYNLYPLYEHFSAKLGKDANEIVWHIENGTISTDGKEIVVSDGVNGALFLVQCWWLNGLELEELEKYGLRVALETSDDASATWKMLDCGVTTGLRIKYGK